MPALTPVQILSGVKRNVRAVGPKPPEPVGRWICHLCPWPAWRDGTYTQWMGHYLEHHQEEENRCRG